MNTQQSTITTHPNRTETRAGRHADRSARRFRARTVAAFAALPLAFAAISLAAAPATAADQGGLVLAAPSDAGPSGPGSIAAPQDPIEPQDPQGPGDLTAEDPGPGPDPAPTPNPGDLANPEKGDDPVGPGDEGNPTGEDDPTHPTGPGDLTAPTPCPTHGVDCGGSEGDGSDGGEDGSGGSKPGEDHFEVEVPTRIDAGLAGGTDASGTNWLVAGGALLTASGAVLGARTRARRRG